GGPQPADPRRRARPLGHGPRRPPPDRTARPLSPRSLPRTRQRGERPGVPFAPIGRFHPMTSSRRRFFQALGTGAASLTFGGRAVPSVLADAARAGGDAADGPALLIGEDVAVADTQHGKVRGYVLRGIHYFLGIPYGADASGPNRFMPPQEPKPWTAVRPALWWGNSAPQNMDNRYANAFVSFRDHWNYDDVSEDCLRLNVFTPALQ